MLMSLTGAVTAVAQDSLVGDLAEACSRLEIVECGFIQTRHVSLVDGDIVSRGNMVYRKPDMLRWEYTSPEPFAFEINGQDISITYGDGGNVTDVSGNRMYREMVRLLLGAVSGELVTDERMFSVKVCSDGRTVTARLTPKKGELKRLWTCMTMHFEADTYKALGIDLTEAGGSETHIEFKY